MITQGDEPSRPRSDSASRRVGRAATRTVDSVASRWRDRVPGPVKRVVAVGFSLGLFPGLFVATWRTWDALDREFARLLLPDQRLLPELLPEWSDGTVRNFSVAICLFAALCGLGILRAIPADCRLGQYKWLALSGTTLPWIPVLGIGILIAIAIRCWPTRWTWQSRVHDDTEPASASTSPGERVAVFQGADVLQGRDSQQEMREIAEELRRPTRWIDAQPRRVQRMLALSLVLAFIPFTSAVTTSLLEHYEILNYAELAGEKLRFDRLYKGDTGADGEDLAIAADPDLQSTYLALLYSIWAFNAVAVVGSIALALTVFRSRNRRAGRYRVLATTGLTGALALSLWWFSNSAPDNTTVMLVWYLF